MNYKRIWPRSWRSIYRKDNTYILSEICSDFHQAFRAVDSFHLFYLLFLGLQIPTTFRLEKWGCQVILPKLSFLDSENAAFLVWSLDFLYDVILLFSFGFLACLASADCTHLDHISIYQYNNSLLLVRILSLFIEKTWIYAAFIHIRHICLVSLCNSFPTQNTIKGYIKSIFSCKLGCIDRLF